MHLLSSSVFDVPLGRNLCLVFFVELGWRVSFKLCNGIVFCWQLLVSRSSLELMHSVLIRQAAEFFFLYKSIEFEGITPSVGLY